MSDVPYGHWLELVQREARSRGFEGGPILDLGCGTGNFTLLLAAAGHEVHGLDGSEEMLAIAREKSGEVSWHRGDFTDFDLGLRFGLVVSVFDSLNNLLTLDSFRQMAARVLAHLRPGGLFIFDVNTRAGLLALDEEGSVGGWAQGVNFHWLNSFLEDRNLAQVHLSWEANGQEGAEVHYERPYEEEELRELLQDVGFHDPEFLNFLGDGLARPDEERLWVIARAPEE